MKKFYNDWVKDNKVEFLAWFFITAISLFLFAVLIYDSLTI